MPSDAMPLIHALQATQDNSLLSFAEIHFPSEMFKLRLMSSQTMLISWMSWSWWMVVPSLQGLDYNPDVASSIYSVQQALDDDVYKTIDVTAKVVNKENNKW